MSFYNMKVIAEICLESLNWSVSFIIIWVGQTVNYTLWTGSVEHGALNEYFILVTWSQGLWGLNRLAPRRRQSHTQIVHQSLFSYVIEGMKQPIKMDKLNQMWECRIFKLIKSRVVRLQVSCVWNNVYLQQLSFSYH